MVTQRLIAPVHEIFTVYQRLILGSLGKNFELVVDIHLDDICFEGQILQFVVVDIDLVVNMRCMAYFYK